MVVLKGIVRVLTDTSTVISIGYDFSWSIISATRDRGPDREPPV